MSALPDLDLSQSHEFFFVAITLSHQQSKTNVIPEMMQILTPNQIVSLSQIYGGKSVKFPSARDLSITLKAVLFIYRTGFFKEKESIVVEDMQLAGSDLTAVKLIANEWYANTKSSFGSGYYKQLIKERAALEKENV